MRSPGWALALVAGALALVPAPARAQAAGGPAIGQGRYWGAFSVEITAPSDARQELIFGSDAEAYNLEGGWRLAGNLDLLFSAGYRQDDGHQVAQGTTVPIANKDTLRLMPLSLSLRYRLAQSAEAWLVPYVRGGLTSVFFHSEAGATVSAGSLWGFKWGVVGGAGILWRIDQLDRNSRRSLRSDGIDALYLDTGFHWQRIDDFGGTGLDLSGVGARIALVAWVR